MRIYFDAVMEEPDYHRKSVERSDMTTGPDPLFFIHHGFVIIEHFKDVAAIGARFLRKGWMLPEGVTCTRAGSTLKSYL